MSLCHSMQYKLHSAQKYCYEHVNSSNAIWLCALLLYSSGWPHRMVSLTALECIYLIIFFWIAKELAFLLSLRTVFLISGASLSRNIWLFMREHELCILANAFWLQPNRWVSLNNALPLNLSFFTSYNTIWKTNMITNSSSFYLIEFRMYWYCGSYVLGRTCNGL